MEIRFSRHAKRKSTIIRILKEKELKPGTHEIVQKAEDFKYPLKIVVDVEDDKITVITSYPLKRGIKK